MAGIARSIALFNQAFRLALPHIAGLEAAQPRISRALSEAIRRRIKLGEDEPVKIAAEALAEIRRPD